MRSRADGDAMMGQAFAMIGRSPATGQDAPREREEPPAVLTRRPPAPMPRTGGDADADSDASVLLDLMSVPDPGLVITEAAMCAWCFQSIVGHFNGTTAAAPPSFDDGSQCDRHTRPSPAEPRPTTAGGWLG